MSYSYAVDLVAYFICIFAQYSNIPACSVPMEDVLIGATSISSNPDDIDNLEIRNNPWISALDDENPSIVFKVDDEDILIDEITVEGTKNVEYIIVELIDASGETVSRDISFT